MKKKTIIGKSKIMKALSIAISIIMLANVFGMVAFADSCTDFSLEDYTFDDLKNMTASEKIELLDKFEREYMSDTLEYFSPSSSMQPMWDSGNNLFGEHEFRTHELITIEAIIELENYLNEYENGATALFRNATEALFISLELSVLSALPDRNSITFVGHFYNPDTGKNYLGLKSPTALTNTVSNYNDAKNALEEYQYLADANEDTLKNIGCMLHFIQDASEPHHSSNVIYNPFNNSHGEFEEYTYNIIDAIIPYSYHYDYNSMQLFSSQSVEYLVDLTATVSHLYIDSVNDVNDKSEWEDVADDCVDLATGFSTIILYKLLKSKHVI